MSILTEPSAGFEATGLSSSLLTAVQKAGLVTPTPIQAKLIPSALSGQDCIGIAQTGTGKTLAFALPILQKLQESPKKALILVPTRELALQVEQSILKVSKFLNRAPRTISLIGGMPIYRQIRDLKGNPHIIIATPGRLRDHLDQGTIQLSQVATLVLDEADRMLDMGFLPQIKYILDRLPKQRQSMLFSATMAPEVGAIASQYLQDPIRIEVARSGSSNEHIKQELCYVKAEIKLEMLEKLLKEHSGTALVFSRTKHGASKLTKKVQEMGHTAAEIHSNRSLGQRRQALDGFKNGRFRVLVATDVASRGIDVPGIAVVINYDLPDAAEDYIHRIGRTGRAERTGVAISLATPDQRRDVQGIERLLQKSLPLSAHSLPVSAQSFSYTPPSYKKQPRSFRSKRNFVPGRREARFHSR